MRLIKRDVVRNIVSILYAHDSIAEYLVSEWGLGVVTAEAVEDWYWTRGL